MKKEIPRDIPEITKEMQERVVAKALAKGKRKKPLSNVKNIECPFVVREL